MERRGTQLCLHCEFWDFSGTGKTKGDEKRPHCYLFVLFSCGNGNENFFLLYVFSGVEKRIMVVFSCLCSVE